MTAEAVRAIFNKHYSGDISDWDVLNEAMMKTSEEVFMTIAAAHAGLGEIPLDIIRTIARGRSRIGLFIAMFRDAKASPAPVVPTSFLERFDHVRKAMLDTVNYMREHYDTVDPWFRKKFDMESLNMVAGDMSEALEKPTGLPANVRGVNFNELNLEEEFFLSALVGLLGVERFKKCADEYNAATKVIRQCQAECKLLQNMPPTKVS
jgi:hypothetical protein